MVEAQFDLVQLSASVNLEQRREDDLIREAKPCRGVAVLHLPLTGRLLEGGLSQSRRG